MERLKTLTPADIDLLSRDMVGGCHRLFGVGVSPYGKHNSTFSYTGEMQFTTGICKFYCWYDKTLVPEDIILIGFDFDFIFSNKMCENYTTEYILTSREVNLSPHFLMDCIIQPCDYHTYGKFKLAIRGEETCEEIKAWYIII